MRSDVDVGRTISLLAVSVVVVTSAVLAGVPATALGSGPGDTATATTTAAANPAVPPSQPSANTDQTVIDGLPVVGPTDDRPVANDTERDSTRPSDYVRKPDPDHPQGAPTGSITDSDGTATLAASDTAQVTHEYQLTPSTPGSIRLVIDYSIPDSYDQFSEYVGSDETVVSERGFTRSGETGLEWDGETNDARVELRVTVNDSVRRSYDTVDTGEWAFFYLHSRSYENADVSVTSAGPGSLSHGEIFAFLGQQSIQRYEGARENFRIILADAADPEVSPDRVFGELNRASRLLNIGSKSIDDELTIWVLPEPIRSGGAATDQGFWVSEGTNFRAGSTYIHEYVHTRQDEMDFEYFSDEESAGWMTEATASLYGTLTNWRLNNSVSFAHLRDQTNVPANTVLANRSTYGGERPGYGQGEGVLVALDYRIRSATDGKRSLQDVLAVVSQRDDVVDAGELKSIAEDVADREFDQFFEEYVYRQNVAPSPPHPGPYDFAETASLDQAVGTGSGVAGGSIVLTKSNATIYNGSPGLPESVLEDPFSTYTVVEPGNDVAVSLPVERLTETTFDDYGTLFLQATTSGERFPRDGVADLAVLGSVDSLPADGGRVAVTGANETTVTVVGPDGTPVPGAAVSVGVASLGEEATVTLATNERGEFLNRSGTRGLELVQSPFVELRGAPEPYPYQSSRARLPTRASVDTRFVVRNSLSELYVSGTAVPGDLSTGSNTVYLLVTSESPTDGVSRSIRVDGDRRKTVEISPRSDYDTWVVPVDLQFDERGTHTISIGDLPARTVTVGAPGNSPPAADAGDDVTVEASETVTLDATGSSDSDGTSLEYSWKQTGGPSVSLSDADTPTPTFTAPTVEEDTALTFEVTVDDGTATDTDTVTVTVDDGSAATARRDVSRSSIAPGGSLETSLSVELDRSADRIAVYDAFEGPIEGTEISSVRIDGQPATDRLVYTRDGKSIVTAVLKNVSAGSEITVTYSLNVDPNASDGGTVAFTGRENDPDVLGEDFEANFETESVAVDTESGVAGFDADDDGQISDSELQTAIQAWVEGNASDSVLSKVIEAWVSGDY